MSAFERWFFRIADSDACWYGLGWLRPAKTESVGPLWIMAASVILGLPGVGVGIGLIYLVLGTVQPEVCWGIFLAVTLVELVLHVISAYFWNKRAVTLRG